MVPIRRLGLAGLIATFGAACASCEGKLAPSDAPASPAPGASAPPAESTTSLPPPGGPTSPPDDATPSPPALQSPVGPDTPCTVAPGAPVKIFDGFPQAFAVDASFVYVSAHAPIDTKVFRVAVTGGAPEAVYTPPAQQNVDPFVIGAGFLYYTSDFDTLVKVEVKGDAFGAPTFAARSAPYPTLGFDGLAVYSGQTYPDTPVVHRWPLDGSPQVDTSLPPHQLVAAIAAGPDGAYAALYDVGTPLTTIGRIVKIAHDGGLVALAEDVGEPTAIAVDDDYVYFAATRGGMQTGGLYRMGFDGSGLTQLTSPAPVSFAVDGHAFYFLRNSLIYKMDKAGGTPSKVGVAQMFGGVVVRGGNVYWSAATDAQEVPAGIYTACK